jgi:hypothetical protein
MGFFKKLILDIIGFTLNILTLGFFNSFFKGFYREKYFEIGLKNEGIYVMMGDFENSLQNNSKALFDI